MTAPTTTSPPAIEIDQLAVAYDGHFVLRDVNLQVADGDITVIVGGSGFVSGTVARRAVSKRMVGQLLNQGKTPVLKGFKSKKGKDFSAALSLDDEGKVRFEFEPRAPSRTPTLELPRTPVGMGCRSCAEGRVIAGRSAWGCDQWREGCGLRIPFQLGERIITPTEAVTLIREGRCGELCMDAGVASIELSSSPAPSEESLD